jgi:ATP-binding cassette subfamily C protein
MPSNQLSSLALACYEFYSFAPTKVLFCLLLMLLRGLTSGIGILLLIPLLQAAGFAFGGSTTNAFSHQIEGLYAAAGISLTLPIILATYVAAISAIALLGYMLTVQTSTLQQRYTYMLRDRLFRALLQARWQFIIEHRMSDFTQSLTGQVQTVGYSAQQILDIVSRIILTTVYVLLSLLLSRPMTLLALGCSLLFFLLLSPLNKKIYRSGNTALLNNKTVFHILTEQLAGLKMIKSYCAESAYADDLLNAGQILEQQHVRMSRFNALTRMSYLIGAALCFSLLFYIAVDKLRVPPATLLLLLLIFSRILPLVSGIQNTFQQLLHRLPAFIDVRKMLDNCIEAAEPISPANISLPEIQEGIYLNNLCFSYPHQDRSVIRNFNLVIPCNSTIALTGPSGAGKSTLVDLIAGLLIPTSGTITCDDIVLEAELRSAWRKNIAYITQEVYLFHDTIRHNLRWVKKDISDTTIWKMLELAAAAEFVARLPQGLDTVIGDRGIRLSGGERQRLALARALLSQPQLLILDEATSALDHNNERKIQKALEHLQGKLTIIIIAHRKTTLEHVDHIIELKPEKKLTVSPER